MPVSYTKEQREQSKAEGKGLITLSYVRPKGGGITIQNVATDEEIDTVREFIVRYLTGEEGGES